MFIFPLGWYSMMYTKDLIKKKCIFNNKIIHTLKTKLDMSKPETMYTDLIFRVYNILNKCQ